MTKARCFFLVLFSLASLSAHGYELATHGRLTYDAYRRSVLGQDSPQSSKLEEILGITLGGNAFGETYYDISDRQVIARRKSNFEESAGRMPEEVDPLSVAGWLLRGAIREDDLGYFLGDPFGPNPPEDEPRAFWRVANHFYDPIHDIPLTVVGANGEKAPDWTLGTTNFLANPAPANTSRRNHYTIRDAREAMYRALTGRTNANGPIADAAPRCSTSPRARNVVAQYLLRSACIAPPSVLPPLVRGTPIDAGSRLRGCGADGFDLNQVRQVRSPLGFGLKVMQWRSAMGDFEVPSGQRADRARLMGRVLDRLGVDIPSLAREGLGRRLRGAVNLCRQCRAAELCRHWVSGEQIGFTYRDFCPNASTFDEFRYR